MHHVPLQTTDRNKCCLYTPLLCRVRQPSMSCVSSNSWTFARKVRIWSLLEFRYNFISLNTAPKWTLPKRVLVLLCLLATAELFLLSWPRLKTSKGTGLSVFSHSSRFLLQTLPVSSCRQPAPPICRVILPLSGPASQEARACTLVWHFTPVGLPWHRLQSALGKMWASPSAVSLLRKLRRPASPVHTTPAKKQAVSKETNQPFTEHQSLPAQLGIKGRQRFVAVLF